MKQQAVRAARRFSRSGEHDTALVRAAYLVLLGREPDADGFHDHLEQLRAGAAWTLILGRIAASEEFDRSRAPVETEEPEPPPPVIPARSLIRATCRAILWREPSEELINHLTPHIDAGMTLPQLVVELLRSDDFQIVAETEHRRDRVEAAQRREQLAVERRLAAIEDRLEALLAGAQR